ncbi:protein-L-isoaspartate O-methyltransferase family protein [Paludibacterium yongneupense]|uniref:protein-L-isoaspartate O-methyltransferase family protein n=1 Tax=Paludibacterium yongneupense TaxID=400061 RepID=UPI000413C20F|nr:protein-L-isoaspartate O-methyltransferase [Paludibacterium yongneupense]
MDFENARFNMIEQQIRPWDVLDAKVLDLLFHVKREDFVEPDKRALAFVDTELPLSNGGVMLQPKQEARLVQDLMLKPDDKVLEIGTGSGYVTALLAKLAGHVHSIEMDPAMLEKAARHLKQADIRNVTLLGGNGVEGAPEASPFDAIFVGGSLPRIPEALKQQLAIGGRMVAVIGDLPVMSALLIERDSETAYHQTTLFETCVARLSGYNEPERFRF